MTLGTRSPRHGARAGDAHTLQQAARCLQAGQLAAARELLALRYAGAELQAGAAHLSARLARSQGHTARAARLLRGALAQRPAQAEWWAELGEMLWSSGRFAEAAAALRQALTLTPAVVAWQQALGACLQQAGDPAQAVEVYLEALECAPREAALHFNLGSALKRQHRLREAAEAYRAALALAPGAADVAFSLGVCLVEMGQFEAAEAALGQALAAGEDVALLDMLGYVHSKLGDGARAMHYCQRARALAPRDPGVLGGLACAALTAGEAGAALSASEALLALAPGDRTGLSSKAIALVELGEDEAAAALAGPERLVGQFTLPPPAGHGDTAAFNGAVLEHLFSHPAVELERSSLSCHEGVTSGEILVDPLGPLAALQRFVRASAERYAATLQLPPGHPFLASRPRRTRLSAWMTMLRDQGYQHGHIHAQAWLSGVYYLCVPAGVGAGEGDARGHDGWLEFGRPPYYFRSGREHPTWAVQPRPGQLLLFPSYLYHRTLPFRDSEPRISIAFDFLIED